MSIRWCSSAAIAFAAVGFLGLCPAWSQTTPVPASVEEDWQVVVGTPDVPAVGPQITSSMCPVTDPTAPFVAFDLNYREYPSFNPGGLQVQVWSGDRLIATASQGSNQLATANETVTWTQRMSLGDGILVYDVSNGQSTTWGQFGQGWRLAVAYTTPVNDLSGYSPDFSVAHSGVSWEANRVTGMTLVQVRYYDARGNLISTDTNPRSVVLGN